jgi:glutamate 5-kinase
MMRSAAADANRLVVKVGSSLVMNNGCNLDQQAMAAWVAQIAHLHRRGKQVILVSSGAVAAGMHHLGWTKTVRQIDRLQAAAAVGQMALTQAYCACFSDHRMRCAQILVTPADLADRERYLNTRATLHRLLRLGVVPIMNENDTLVTDQLKFGDNDTLGALVANLLEAQVLIILTDQNGLYTADPRKNAEARFVAHAEAGDPALETMADGVGTAIGRGGMITKILAAKRAAQSGSHTIIANGREPDVLLKLVDGCALGTHLFAQTARITARKQWLAGHFQRRGHVVLDDGACLKLSVAGKSLLPVGMIAVHGVFIRGEVIACVNQRGQEVARGLANYSSAEAQRILGLPSSRIATVLGYMLEPEFIHRDNLVLIESAPLLKTSGFDKNAPAQKDAGPV